MIPLHASRDRGASLKRKRASAAMVCGLRKIERIVAKVG
jgi:hypothetical protein